MNQKEKAGDAMENHLQEIRAKHPGLNPTETYKLLSKALIPAAMESYKAFKDSLDEYESLLNEKAPRSQKRAESQSAQSQLDDQWYEIMMRDHQEIADIGKEVVDSFEEIPGNPKIQKIVAVLIAESYPEFYEEVLAHQQWLKVNLERLDRAEQRCPQDEPNQTTSKDAYTR